MAHEFPDGQNAASGPSRWPTLGPIRSAPALLAALHRRFGLAGLAVGKPAFRFAEGLTPPLGAESQAAAPDRLLRMANQMSIYPLSRSYPPRRCQTDSLRVGLKVLKRTKAERKALQTQYGIYFT